MTLRYNRRDVLNAVGSAGALALGVSLAGCSSSNTSNAESTTTTEETSKSSDGGDTWKKTSTVDMTNELKFDPDHIQVSKGTKVTWKNTSGIGHTVTAYEDEIPDGATYFASGGFDSEQAARDGYGSDKGGMVAKGKSYSHTFETKGEYKYFCIPHEMSGMIGYVKVV